MEQKEKLWNINYVKVWLANFMIFFSFMIVTPLLPLYLSDTYSADKDTIGFVLSGYTLTALVARPLAGYLVDSYKRKVVLLTCYFLFFAFFAGYLIAGTMTLFTLVRTLHGAPMGSVTVANSTSAIDVLAPSRRAEGIGYYGLSNNLATSIAPTAGLMVYDCVGNYDTLFVIALCAAGLGFCINASVKFPDKEIVPNKSPMSFDRFFLVEGWSEGLVMVCIGLSYGVLATYLAIYGKEALGMTAGTGAWFAVLSGGLILSRLVGARNPQAGQGGGECEPWHLGECVWISAFCRSEASCGILWGGTHHRSWQWTYMARHADHVYQSCAKQQEGHGQFITVDMLGHRHGTWSGAWWIGYTFCRLRSSILDGFCC